MGKAQETENLVRSMADAIAEDLGLRIYDLRYRPSGPRAKIQVFLQRPGDQVSIQDCMRLSRQLSRGLDAADPIAGAYDLEVSSPGLERELREPRHWSESIGETVKVKWRNGDGRVHVVRGRLAAVDDQSAHLDLPDEDPIDINLSAVVKARLVFE